MSSIRNTQYLTVLRVFAGIQKFELSVSIWLREGIAIPLNTAKYYMGTRLNTSCQAGQADFVQTAIVTSNSHAM